MIKSLLTYLFLLFIESIVIAAIIFVISYYPLQNEFAIHVKYINFVYLTFGFKIMSTNFIALMSAIDAQEKQE